MLATEHLIHIEEVPLWIVYPFGAFVAAALTWAVRWVLRGRA